MSFLTLGCMNFGLRTPEDEAQRVIDRALDAGIRVLDTANIYTDGESERVVGRALRRLPPSLRHDVKVHTKVGFVRYGDKPEGLSPASIRRAVDQSLGRLGIERIDVYYMHTPDRTTPIEESLATMGELVRAGKIAEIGASNYASWELLEMFGVCERLGIGRPVISQLIYNVLIRQIEIEYVRFALKYGMHTTVYNPLAGGLLARALPNETEAPADSRLVTNKLYTTRYLTRTMVHAAAAIRDACAAHGMSPIDFAYAWVRDRPGVGSVIVGPASVAHLDAALAAWEQQVPPELAARVDEIHAEMVGTDARYAR